MSLINDALKKAQRQRAGDEPASNAGGGLAGGRGQGKNSTSLALIAGGALVLVVGSVAGTIFLLNRSAEKKPALVADATPPEPAVTRPSTAAATPTAQT